MSRISDIYKSYRQALKDSQEQYENLYRERATAARKFYREWFKDLIICYKDNWANQVQIDRIRRNVEAFFQRNQIDFCAIDGSCAKDPFTDFMVFFGASYGVKGQGGPYCQDSFFKNLRAQHTFGWLVIGQVVRVIKRSLLPFL